MELSDAMQQWINNNVALASEVVSFSSEKLYLMTKPSFLQHNIVQKNFFQRGFVHLVSVIWVKINANNYSYFSKAENMVKGGLPHAL
jgi:hypothetical protein